MRFPSRIGLSALWARLRPYARKGRKGLTMLTLIFKLATDAPGVSAAFVAGLQAVEAAPDMPSKVAAAITALENILEALRNLTTS